MKKMTENDIKAAIRAKIMSEADQIEWKGLNEYEYKRLGKITDISNINYTGSGNYPVVIDFEMWCAKSIDDHFNEERNKFCKTQGLFIDISEGKDAPEIKLPTEIILIEKL